MAMAVSNLNHAVLYVRDAVKSAEFYSEALGFEEVARVGNGAGVFLKAGGGTNHHDLGLFSVGPAAPLPAPGRVGLYHLAWEVPKIEDLVELRQRLLDMGALVGQSDHGVSKSLYAKDVDGNEFEVMWTVPPEDWGSYAQDAVTKHLDLDAALAQYAGL